MLIPSSFKGLLIDVTERSECVCASEEGCSVCQSSRGAESLLKGPALEKPAKAINRICNGRDGTEGGMMGKLWVAEGVDANSCSPKRKEGGGKAKAGSVSHNSKSIERANPLVLDVFLGHQLNG